MTQEYKVDRGIVVDVSSGISVSVSDFWEYSKGQEYSPEGLHLQGYALPYLEIVNNGFPQLKIGIRSETGNFLIPDDFRFPSDHYVISDNWIPLMPESDLVLERVLQIRNLQINQELSVADFLYLLNAANNSNIDLKYDPEISLNFKQIISDAAIARGV